MEALAIFSETILFPGVWSICQSGMKISMPGACQFQSHTLIFFLHFFFHTSIMSDSEYEEEVNDLVIFQRPGLIIVTF